MSEVQFEVSILNDRTHQYRAVLGGESVAYGEVLQLWQDDADFRSSFASLLADSPFKAFKWETPAVTRETLDRDFEFVLLDSPRLARKADRKTFARQFAEATNDDGIAVFDNLGKNAVMIVPAPDSKDSHYDQLAGFCRRAPAALQSALWQTVAKTMCEQISDRPMWLSTAGGGVAWLHVRLDSRPKYYGYVPYKGA